MNRPSCEDRLSSLPSSKRLIRQREARQRAKLQQRRQQRTRAVLLKLVEHAQHYARLHRPWREHNGLQSARIGGWPPVAARQQPVHTVDGAQLVQALPTHRPISREKVAPIRSFRPREARL